MSARDEIPADVKAMKTSDLVAHIALACAGRLPDPRGPGWARTWEESIEAIRPHAAELDARIPARCT